MNYQLNNIDGWMNDAELQWLYEQAQRVKTIVEVGCWFGRSTHALLSGCPGFVYAVDHFNGSASEIDGPHAFAKTGRVYDEFIKNVGEFQNLRILKMDSLSAAAIFADKGAEMVFIDGDHEYAAVKKDLEAWMPKCSKLFCGHDRNHEGVARALQDFGISIEEVPGTLIWISRIGD